VNFLRQYLVAVHYFTGLPISGGLAHWAGLDGAMPAARAEHFPGVGWLVGLGGCVVFAVLGLALHANAFTPVAAAVGCLAATIAITRATHEEAWAALFGDSLPGRVTKPVLALLLGVLARVALLAVLAAHSPAGVLAALFAGQVVSRFWPLILLQSLAYAGDGSATDRDTLGAVIDNRSLAIAGAWCVIPLAVVGWGQGPGFALVGLLLSGVAMLALRQWLVVRTKGLTRDGFVASQLACEIGFYLGAAMGLR